jgi:hypothetical protein
MARRDYYHNTVRLALEKDGWTITHEPMVLPFASTKLEVDLAGEKLVAEKGMVKIAVEVKNFLGNTMNVSELQKSYGQFVLYRTILSTAEPGRKVYLAVTEQAYQTVFSDAVVQKMLAESNVSLVIFDPTSETIVAWKH